jgi:hypothetical protein
VASVPDDDVPLVDAAVVRRIERHSAVSIDATKALVA